MRETRATRLQGRHERWAARATSEHWSRSSAKRERSRASEGARVARRRAGRARSDFRPTRSSPRTKRTGGVTYLFVAAQPRGGADPELDAEHGCRRTRRVAETQTGILRAHQPGSRARCDPTSDSASNATRVFKKACVKTSENDYYHTETTRLERYRRVRIPAPRGAPMTYLPTTDLTPRFVFYFRNPETHVGCCFPSRAQQARGRPESPPVARGDRLFIRSTRRRSASHIRG